MSPGFFVLEPFHPHDPRYVLPQMSSVEMQATRIHTGQGAASFAMAMCSMTITHAMRPPGRHSRIS